MHRFHSSTASRQRTHPLHLPRHAGNRRRSIHESHTHLHQRNYPQRTRITLRSVPANLSSTRSARLLRGSHDHDRRLRTIKQPSLSHTTSSQLLLESHVRTTTPRTRPPTLFHRNRVHPRIAILTHRTQSQRKCTRRTRPVLRIRIRQPNPRGTRKSHFLRIQQQL